MTITTARRFAIGDWVQIDMSDPCQNCGQPVSRCLSVHFDGPTGSERIPVPEGNPGEVVAFIDGPSALTAEDLPTVAARLGDLGPSYRVRFGDRELVFTEAEMSTARPRAYLRLLDDRKYATARCFGCEREFAIEGKVWHLHGFNELCTRRNPGDSFGPCSGANGDFRGHRWDCAAIGGHLCPDCADKATTDLENFLIHMKMTAQQLAERAEHLSAYAGALWLTQPE